ncbi:MAG: hypothetical protein ACREDK_04735 [Thermoplasmata archaeon]
MPSPTQIAFVIIHAALNAYVIGGLAVGLTATREVFPRWNEYPFWRVLLDATIAGLIVLLVILVAIKMSIAS